MARQAINLGSAANDGTGDCLRDAGTKINANFVEVYTALPPVGFIGMFSGTVAQASALTPTWGLCDGTANAPGPDLRDKFIVGASQDHLGVAKTNVEGSLKQTGGVTSVQPSAHGNLVHAGGAVANHTGLTHGLTIADHPDLTHAAITFNAQTLAHGDHAIASFSGTVASRADLSRPSGSIASHAAGSVPSASIASRADLSGPSMSIASRADLSMPSGSIASHAAGSVPSQGIAVPSAAGVASFATSTNRSGLTAFPAHTVNYASIANASGPSRTFASHAAGSLPSLTLASNAAHSMPSLTIAAANNASDPSRSFASGADVSMPSLTHSHAGSTLTHADHVIASATQGIADHKGTAYGVHTFTAPAAHGAAGTLVHAFTQPDDHVISPHDAVVSVPVYYALAFIQRMQ
jgi:hypothetical protein